MRIISIDDLQRRDGLFDDIADVLRDEGLVCLPIGRHYGIAAALRSESAVMRLVQSKRRTRRAPSLVFVPDLRALEEIVAEVPETARHLMDAFWPGPLTLLLRPGDGLPPRVRKTLARSKRDKLGVRITDDPVCARVVERLGEPILLSSANIARKVGSNSVAQVRKNFARAVDLMIDAGDLPSADPSTIVDPESAQIRRDGAIPAHRVQALLDAGRSAS